MSDWRKLSMAETMENFRFGVWIGIIALFLLLPLNVIAQPGFLSIDCGAKANYTSQNNIRWVTDDDYIQVGEKAYTGDTSQAASGSHMQNLRYFPKPLNKSCYQLPVVPNVPFLFRLWFVIGSYSGFAAIPKFAYSIETRDLLFVRNVTAQKADIPVRGEKILVSSGSVLYLCLIRTSEMDDPFINAIELRTLQTGMYHQAQPGTMLNLSARFDFGANSSVRYPVDKFDRLWQPDVGLKQAMNADDIQYIHYVKSEEPISTTNTQDLPPSVVMQTAWVMASSASLTFNLDASVGTNSLLLLYFADIQPLKMGETRSFSLEINGQPYGKPITLVPNSSAVELQIPLDMVQYQLRIATASNSRNGIIINAFEYYVIVHTEPATDLKDIEALDDIKSSFDRKSWISDPCYVIDWDGIGCDKSITVRRISEIKLSGMNLTGSIPQSIGQLTALVNVSLDNNQLTGPLPNFSNLTMLERLYLQNNNLSGSLPEWLSELKNLKELFIENNEFTGIIPVQLLKKPSLKLNYSGNHDLCIRMHRGKCIMSNSRKGKASVVLGIAISGAVLIVLVLVCIAVHRKKFREKKCLSKGQGII